MSEPEDLGSSFQSRIKRVLNDPNFLDVVETIVKNSIQFSFKDGGAYGDGKFGGGKNKWIKSFRAEDESGMTLREEGNLLRSVIASVKAKPSGQGLVIETGSNLPYAAIHQFGGKIPITAKSKAFFRNKAKGSKTNKWFNLFKSAMNKAAFNMPARPYLVLQDEDVEDIVQAFGKRFGS